MKVTKRQKTWAALDTNKMYSFADAIEALRPYCSKKFDESLEIAVRLSVDVTKADQNIRGMLSLPNGTGKKVRVAVFTSTKQDEATKAGADVVGGVLGDDGTERIVGAGFTAGHETQLAGGLAAFSGLGVAASAAGCQRQGHGKH